jgi:penicillin-binding protein 1B
VIRTLTVLAVLGLLASPAFGASLEERIGRAEVRVYSAPYAIAPTRTVRQSALPERLERLRYRRVSGRPARPGEYFWGSEVFWIYRRAFRRGGSEEPALLFGLRLEGGKIVGAVFPEGSGRKEVPPERWVDIRLEPEVLAESLAADRAPRRPVTLAGLPERVWRPILATEDARFFEHSGLDARSLARALLANAMAGKVTQGGSTITQQLVKNRDLSPRRTLGRKFSEAVRALSLESEHDKTEILEAYLNHVYLGHVDGLAIHGIGAAARAYFSKEPEALTLGEAALLAAMIQSPNRYSPFRHLDRVVERQRWVLTRMEELKWASPEQARRARASRPVVRHSAPGPAPAAHFTAWMATRVKKEEPGWVEGGKGVVVEATLDPHLQRIAESAVATHLRDLRKRHRSLRGKPLNAVLVALDARSGAVLAYVGGEPKSGAVGFDRARGAKRQPGSTVKPLVLLEAFEECGGEDPLYPQTRVADQPLAVETPSGNWRPANSDGRFHGTVTLRSSLVWSWNVPFVRVARHCGLNATAERLRRAGLPLSEEPPPSFVLGAIEATPLDLAHAFTVFPSGGESLRPWAYERIETPGRRRLAKDGPRAVRVVAPETAFLVRDLMRDAVLRGTARAARLPGLNAAGKTGTSSERRDAWFVGDAGSVVTVVWVGLDDGSPLGLSGTAAAAPLWRTFMSRAVPARPPHSIPTPGDVVVRAVDPKTGLRVRPGRRGAISDLFHDGNLPPRDWFFFSDPVPVIR